jgi:hypothetical protein
MFTKQQYGFAYCPVGRIDEPGDEFKINKWETKEALHLIRPKFRVSCLELLAETEKV